MKRRIWGFILLALGVLVFLQTTGVFNFGLAFWPVLLLLLGVAIIWESVSFGFISWVFLGLGLWVGGIGLFNILANAGLTELSGDDLLRYGWPLTLVAIGLSIIIGDRSRAWNGFVHGSRGQGKYNYTKMRHIGDLYHGRTAWIMDRDQEFYHGIGDVLIDFTTAEIKPGFYKVFLKAGIGEVTVRIPEELNVNVNASVGIGELDLFGETRSGIAGISLSRNIQVEEAEATLEVEIKLGIGDLKVQHMPKNVGDIS